MFIEKLENLLLSKESKQDLGIPFLLVKKNEMVRFKRRGLLLVGV